MKNSKWDSFDFGYTLTTSASQIESFAGDIYNAKKGEVHGGCNRQWWFKKVHKLPEAKARDARDFGGIMHEVCERWLLADDTGRDRTTGEAVDSFPEGWDITIGLADAALIKTLFQKAIDTGMLRRQPDRKIEAPFQIAVLPDGQASVIGFLDLQLPRGVEDHKTTGNMDWAKSREGLRQNVQMLLYGCVVAREWMNRGKDLDDLKAVELRHNVFLKDFQHPLVRPTGTEVDIDTLSKFWDDVIVPAAKKMLYWKQAGILVDDWAKVDGPKRRGVCKKYGGCDFQTICGVTETPKTYRQRVERTAPPETTETTMGNIFDKLKQRDESSGSSAPSDPPNKPAEQVSEPTTAVADSAPPTIATVAPWAFPGCRACGGIGFSTKGKPCTPCVIQGAKQPQGPGLHPDSFDLRAADSGILVFKGDELVASIPLVGTVEAKENTAPQKPKEEPVADEPPPLKGPVGVMISKEEKIAPLAGQKKSVEPSKAKTSGTKRGRPRRGFTLLYGVVKRGKENVLDLNLVLHQYGKELADDLGSPSYWGLDAFKRREFLAMKAEEIAETFGPAVVVVTTDDPDIRAFAAALEPYAADVFVGLNR
jgi:hypothetical protein